MLAAGISGFREPFATGRNASADVLHRWAEKNHFLWLVSKDIVDEYKEVLQWLRVRPNLIGRVVNLIRERAEEVRVRPSIEISPDPKDAPFCLCSEQGKADFLITLNPQDFPQDVLKATVTWLIRLNEAEVIRAGCDMGFMRVRATVNLAPGNS